jgi:hypothetical protein
MARHWSSIRPEPHSAATHLSVHTHRVPHLAPVPAIRACNSQRSLSPRPASTAQLLLAASVSRTDSSYADTVHVDSVMSRMSCSSQRRHEARQRTETEATAVGLLTSSPDAARCRALSVRYWTPFPILTQPMQPMFELGHVSLPCRPPAEPRETDLPPTTPRPRSSRNETNCIRPITDRPRSCTTGWKCDSVYFCLSCHGW